jgi:heme/copper-type cytochrome/quinol oxidase subunit 3
LQPINIISKPAHSAYKELPGDLAIWFFIFAELTVFAMFFISFAWMDSRNPEMFSAGKTTLHACITRQGDTHNSRSLFKQT